MLHSTKRLVLSSIDQVAFHWYGADKIPKKRVVGTCSGAGGMVVMLVVPSEPLLCNSECYALGKKIESPKPFACSIS
jgi:hypothetical protein